MSKKSYDYLTSLLDADSLVDTLSSKNIVNYFLINIDNFSNINNAYGYEIGSRVLQEVSKYLTLSKPHATTLYRYNSDRFVLLADQNLSIQEIKKICESLLSFFAQTDIVIDDDIEFKVSLSISVSTAKGSINISQAEVAMQELRESKRNHFILFNPYSEFVHKQQQNIYWIHKIKEAVLNEEIVAYFQPIINNHTGKIEKFECLARLKDDDEIISPVLFLGAAKLTGNLPYITKSLIAQSFKKFSDTEYEFSINITGDDLSQDYLESFLLKNVNKYNIDPSRVVLEILEDIDTLDKGTTLKQLNALRENGFKIAIDDFGAENSNFSRLLDIEPDYLKIDGAFIKNITTDTKSQIIVEAIVGICKKSGIKVIAEFIHNEEVQNKVKELNIDYSQGYFFGAPSPELAVL